MKIVIEDEFKPEEVAREDGGSALIWTTKSFPEEEEDDPSAAHDEGTGVFFRFQSWDWPDQKHQLFKQFVGKKVRITIESLDALDLLSEIE